MVRNWQEWKRGLFASVPSHIDLIRDEEKYSEELDEGYYDIQKPVSEFPSVSINVVRTMIEGSQGLSKMEIIDRLILRWSSPNSDTFDAFNRGLERPVFGLGIEPVKPIFPSEILEYMRRTTEVRYGPDTENEDFC